MDHLIQAAKSDDIQYVRELLDLGWLPNIQDKFGNTALINASKYSIDEMVELLLQRGADSNIQSNSGRTALIEASRRGHVINIVEMLLRYGADPNIQDLEGQTSLIAASSDGHIDIVRLLLDNDADPNIRDRYGMTALLDASRWGNTDIVKLLLDNGADPNIKNQYGETPYDIAISNGHIGIARLIREHIDLQRARQNLAFMKSFLDRDDLDIDTASRIFGNERSYNPGVDIRTKDEYRKDPLTKSKQRLATMRGIRDNHSVLQYLREPELMRNVDSYLTSMRPYPNVHSRMMLEDKKGGKRNRKYYTRKRY
jgi:ankyrin repeat protein